MKTKLLPALLLLIFSCEKETEQNATSFFLDSGIFIINEGTFGQGNGSVSYLSADNQRHYNDVYQLTNGTPLGDVVQSMYIYNSTGYIVVNNSQKVEVVSLDNFKSRAVITGFSSPRFFLAVSGTKAYVTDWISNTVKVVNLSNNSVTGSIPAGAGPEQLLLSGSKVYVVNVGGFGSDSTVTVIDAVADTVLKTMQVGINPSSIVKNAAGEIVVLCSGSTGPDYTGGTADDIAGSIIKIDPANDSIIYNHPLDQFHHPVKMQMNGTKDKFYMLGGMNGFTGNIVEFDFPSGTFSTLVNEVFYGLGVDPVTGNIYGGRPGFTQNNYMVRYSSSGNLLDSILVGIGPNSFAYKY